jgi:hypothetical protein
MPSGAASDVFYDLLQTQLQEGALLVIRSTRDEAAADAERTTGLAIGRPYALLRISTVSDKDLSMRFGKVQCPWDLQWYVKSFKVNGSLG